MSTRTGRTPISRLSTAFVITVLALVLAVPAASAAPKTKLASQNTAGDQSSEWSGNSDISANGGQVVFEADGDLLGTDTNGDSDIYRRIIGSKKTKLVSRAHGGGLANDRSYEPSISANGRYVVFESYASNLTPVQYQGRQVYRRDLLTGKTRLASKGSKGVSDEHCSDSAVSSTGRYVVFASTAGNLTKKNTNGFSQVYLRDMKTKATVLISQAKGYAGNGPSYRSAVSADGRFVAFVSSARNLSPKDERGVDQVFLRDRKLGKTYLISKNSKGKAGDGESDSVVMSANGKVVVFASDARNLIAWGVDSNDRQDIYKYSRVTKKMRRVSVKWNGKQLAGDSRSPDVSADGKVIVFKTDATGVLKYNRGTGAHLYRRGPSAGSIKLVDRNDAGQAANGKTIDAAISADGRFVSYTSWATNLTKGTDDNGGVADVFRTGPF